MHVISRKALVDFSRRFPDARTPLDSWFRIACEAEWCNIRDVRRVFPHADAVVVESGNTATIFNIGGNKYRLVAAIHYNRQKLFVLKVMTHKEYDAGRWKESL